MESPKRQRIPIYRAGTIYRRARRLGLEIPWRSRFNIQEKRAILQEATRNGTGVTVRLTRSTLVLSGIGAGNWGCKVLHSI
jgi:hypothetical protein